AAKAVGAVTAKVPTSATEAQPATVGNKYFIVTAFSRKSGKFRPWNHLTVGRTVGNPNISKLLHIYGVSD
ncbi:MAG: hypothetical protein ACTH12_08235, partial [Brevibacterium aurantiacum]